MPSANQPADLGTVASGLSHLDITFDKPLNPHSFGPEDVLLRRGTISIPVQHPIHQGGNTWRIPFAPQHTPGMYIIQLGPDITDVAGNLMNQNGDATNGDYTADRFVASFAVLSPESTPPIVALLSPNGGSYAVGDTIAVEATASDASGISHVQVELYQGGSQDNHRVGIIFSNSPGEGNPGTISWTIPEYLNGRPLQGSGFTIKFVAWDAAGGPGAVTNNAAAAFSASDITIIAPLPLGIDRWWATAGDEYLPVTWTVDVPEQDNYRLSVTSGWAPRGLGGGGARVRILTMPGLPVVNMVPGDMGNHVAQIPELSPGRHQLRIEAFRVPTAAGLSNASLVLYQGGKISPVDTLMTTLIADHADIAATLPRGQFTIALETGAERTLIFTSPDELVRYFAPILQFEPQERYSVPFPIERSLGADPVRDEGIGARNDAIDLSVWKTGNFRPYDSPSAVYASLLHNVANGELAINYFFHYPLSNWKEHGGHNTHQGDWEGATIFLEQSRRSWIPTRVALAQHVEVAGGLFPDEWGWDGGDRVLWTNLNVSTEHGGERPILYVGLGGHATYAHAGETPLLTPSGWKVESHHGGIEYTPHSSTVHYLPRLGDPSSPDWLRYPGHWGIADDDGSIGPRGPAFQDLRVAGSAPGLRWLDPWAWSAGFNYLVPPTPATVFSSVDQPQSDFTNNIAHLLLSVLISTEMLPRSSFVTHHFVATTPGLMDHVMVDITVRSYSHALRDLCQDQRVTSVQRIPVDVAASDDDSENVAQGAVYSVSTQGLLRHRSSVKGKGDCMRLLGSDVFACFGIDDEREIWSTR